MKLLKTLSLGLLVGAATLGSASAQLTVIHVAGSTAFRTATSIAIIDALAGTTPTPDGIGGGSITGSTTVYAAYDTAGKNISNSNGQIFANGTIGTGGTATIVVEAFWTGSLAGVTDLVAGSSTATFLDETNAGVISTVNASPITAGTYVGASQITTPVYHAAGSGNVVHLAMSDSIKTTISKELATGTLTGTLPGTSYTGSAGLAALSTAINGSNVIDAGTSNFAGSNGRVAIVPFEWCISKGGASATGISNITQQEARALFSTGAVSQGLFTGGATTADVQNYIYLTGRNEDSGTRIGALSESQYGVTVNPVQWQFGDGSTSATTPIQKFLANSALNTEPQISWANAGHSGFASGGNVGNALKLTLGTGLTITGKPSANTGAAYCVGYLGITDATSAINGGLGATALTYNGVAFSANAIENGSYTFWTYEHAYRLGTVSSSIANVIDAIADNIYAVDADVIYTGTGSGVAHGYNPVDGTYTTGVSGLFDALNINRSTTEGLPVTN